MNEYRLKELFISSVKKGHIRNNNDLFFPAPSPEVEIMIKNEFYFRNFDLVIGVIRKSQNHIDSANLNDQNIRLRSGLLTHFAISEKCRIESISFYPVEIKSDDDILDERLPNQILNAILTFGRSYLVLGKSHTNKATAFLKLLPTTIIGYTGTEDYFQIINVFDRFVVDPFFNLPKRQIIKILHDNGMVDEVDRIYRRLSALQMINQKLIFNFLKPGSAPLLSDELQFLKELANVSSTTGDSKKINKIIRESLNWKITEF